MTGIADDLLTEEQLAEELGYSTRTLVRWRAQRTGPAYIRLGRQIRYRRGAVRDWLLSLEQQQPRAGRDAA